MFYIDELYLSDASNCYTLYLKRKNLKSIYIGKCFVSNNFAMDTAYTWSEKDTRNISEMFMDGLKQMFRNGEYLLGQAQDAASKVAGVAGRSDLAEKAASASRSNIVHGLTPQYKDYNKIPLYEHSKTKHRLPDVTFIFVNKDDKDTMLTELQHFLLLVGGINMEDHTTTKNVTVVNKKTKKTEKQTVVIHWNTSSWYAKGGEDYTLDNKDYQDGQGFILKQGAMELSDLYLESCTVIFSKDTDMQGRPHSAQVQLKFIQPKNFWPSEMYSTVNDIKSKAK